ncbi:hypothetical protein ACSTS3_00740 [Aquimarina muelleri]|uniref:hypothetical protein n=1 Tax=Aquimarina muelleri TaxID=279356 RepID=UPI003F689310
MKYLNSLSKNTNVFRILLIVSLILNYSVVAQGLSEAPAYQQGRNLKLDDLFNKVKKGYKDGLPLDKIKGSPYLSENFTRGDVYYETNPIGKLYMRYNIFSDEIEIKKNTKHQEYAALIKSTLINCVINDQKLIYGSFKPINKIAENGYLISLTNPSKAHVLYKRIKKIFRDRGVEASTSLSKASPAKFSTFISYYILTEDSQEAKELPRKSKKLYLLFPEQDHSSISNFIKGQKINPKKEKDLIQLFNFINNLNSKN